MKAAIFDVDGTLLDSMDVWMRATSEFFRSNGIDASPEKSASFREMTLEESLPQIIAECGLDMTFEQVRDIFFEAVARHYRDDIPLKPYAREYLDELRADGIPMAITTSGYRELFGSAFDRLGITDYFDAVVLSADVGEGKDTGKIYLRAAELLGVEPKDCMVYEDIIGGIMGAKSVGMQTTAVADPTNAEITSALKQHSDHYITGWAELLKR